MALLRVIALAGLTLSSLVPAADARLRNKEAKEPMIEAFPRLYEDFMSIFESLGGRRYMEAIQNGEEINAQQDFTALDNFFGECLRTVVQTDVVFLRPDVLNGYENIQACVDGVCADGQEEIRYVQNVNTAAGTDFRFGFDGPGNLQGTFWIRDESSPDGSNANGAVLMNFAKSLDPFPLSPGAVLNPDPDGVNFKIRIAGDRTFAFSTDGGTGDSAFDQAIRQDLIYEYRLTSGNSLFNAPGAIASPTAFDVFPTFKVPGMPCIRIRFNLCLSFIYFLRMSIADADDEFPGSRIWNVADLALGTTVNSFRYIQIVDGQGDILPANTQFAAAQANNEPDLNGAVVFRGLRDNTPLVPCGIVI